MTISHPTGFHLGAFALDQRYHMCDSSSLDHCDHEGYFSFSMFDFKITLYV